MRINNHIITDINKAFGLPDVQKNQKKPNPSTPEGRATLVKICVLNQSNASGVSGFFYHIGEFFLSIFGSSDMQKATNAMLEQKRITSASSGMEVKKVKKLCAKHLMVYIKANKELPNGDEKAIQAKLEALRIKEGLVERKEGLVERKGQRASVTPEMDVKEALDALLPLSAIVSKLKP